MFICIVLLVNWFKCYGNDIYLIFDPVNSKRAELFFFFNTPGLGFEELKSSAINTNGEENRRARLRGGGLFLQQPGPLLNLHLLRC